MDKMNMKMSAKDRRIGIAQQKADELLLNPILIKETKRIRSEFGIPENGFLGSVACMNWQRKLRRRRDYRLNDWYEEIVILRQRLNKASGWHDRLEKYLMYNKLSAPSYSVAMVHHVDLELGPLGRSLRIIDDPVRIEDIVEVLDRDYDPEYKTQKSPRLYNVAVWKLIQQLSKTRLQLTDQQIANEVNARFGTEYSYNNISSIRAQMKKKFGTSEK